MPFQYVPDQVWPPVFLLPVYTKMAEWAAWYSGEPDRIISAYATRPVTTAQTANPWWRFWSRARDAKDGAQRALIHVPIATDLAAVSAALLFGEPPRIRVRQDPYDTTDDETQCEECLAPAPAGHLGGHMVTDPVTGLMPPTPKMPLKSKIPPETPEDKTQARLLEMIEGGDVYARLVEAAEGAAAIGGIYIYPVWDPDLRDFPLMAIAQSDMAVPEFRHGILTAVTFHRTIQTQGQWVWRHLERHEVEGTGDSRRAVVLNAIYKGASDRLGQVVNLGVGDTIGDVGNIQERVELPFQELDVEYIPNRRPNPLWRASGIGASDIQGSETLLDALDETYASWMRDIRLAKARILVPREYLRPDSTGSQAFDIDQEIYVGMDMEPGMAQDARAMMAHQFQIRYLEHQETSRELIARIVSNAGYSPSTIGTVNPKGDVGTGTALRISEHKTLLTLRRKGAWWSTAIANVLYRMQLIDVAEFGQSYTPMRPTVTMADSIIDNPLELAQTAMALMTAEAASIETRVKIVNPDLSEPEVQAEVSRIKDEAKASTPPSVGTAPPGQFGAKATDPASTPNLPKAPGAAGPAPTNPPPQNPPTAKSAG